MAYRQRVGQFQLNFFHPIKYVSTDDLMCVPGSLIHKGCVLFIWMLLIVGNIELNPGPFTEHRDGKWNKSENCTWNESNVLGRGATAVVYKARNKHNGTICAVKVFHERISTHGSTVPIREMQILRKLNHPNIISILGIEQEFQTGNQVLLMEYCEGGSLYAMLDQPKYAYGFPEEEFLVVLKHIVAGLQYLRQNDMVHRDIKPGNIIRFITYDGSSVYKLTDFGAARELEEEEEFTSIYGTEEYLDPHMFERAVLQKRRDKMFGANVDLWSLGVTIYHVATGQLPFQPYGGRNNARTMFHMTTEKASGVISGKQRSENGPIEWGRELPSTCSLSSSLKSLITPLVAGLLECNTSRRSTFESVFSVVTDIMDMKILKVFSVVHGSNFKIYINGSKRYAGLQECIAAETQIPSINQLILWTNRQLCDVIDPMVAIRGYPITILKEQLYLYSKDGGENCSMVMYDIPSFPDFNSYVQYDKDSSTAKASAAVAYFIERQIQILSKRQNMMIQSQVYLSEHLHSLTDSIDECFPHVNGMLEETSKRQNTFYRSFESCYGYLELLMPIFQSCDIIDKIVHAKTQVKKILSDTAPKDVMTKAKLRSEEIKVYMSVLVQKIKDQMKEAVVTFVGCPEEDNCNQKAKFIQTNISDIWVQFQKHRKQKDLSQAEKFAHASDRLKLTEYCVQLQSLMQGHCVRNSDILHDNVMKHTGMLIKNLQRTKKVDQNITNVIDCQKKLTDRIDKMEEDCLKLNSELQNVMMLKLQSQLETRSAPGGRVPEGSTKATLVTLASDESAYASASHKNESKGQDLPSKDSVYESHLHPSPVVSKGVDALTSNESAYSSNMDELSNEIDKITKTSLELKKDLEESSSKLSLNSQILNTLIVDFSLSDKPSLDTSVR